VAGTCGYGEELSGSINAGNFLTSCEVYWLASQERLSPMEHVSRNERVTLQVYDTCLQMFHVCTLRHTAHIKAIVQFLSYSDQQVKCDGLHSRGNSVLQIRYAHGL
jgi:uncharacterized protein involved in propanediol utilization